MPLPSRIVMMWFASTFWRSSVRPLGHRTSSRSTRMHRAEPEMLARIVLAKVARSGFHFANLRSCSCRRAELRADTVAIALRPDQANEQRVAAAAAVVAEKVGGLTVVRDQQIQIPIVVDVARHEPAAHLFQREARPGAATDLDEAAGGDVAEQEIALRVGRPRTELRRVVHDVAVGEGKIELHVVVEVEEHHAESDEWKRRRSDPALGCRVREQPPPRPR